MEIIEEVYRTGQVENPDGTKTNLSSAISRDEGMFLYAMLRDHLPNGTVVEVGCANGLSSLFIWEALKERKDAAHIIIDPSQSTVWNNRGIHQLKRAGHNAFELIEMTSGDALPRLTAEKAGSCGAVFIDGWHTFDQTLVDIYYALKLVTQNGLIIVDDASWTPVAKAVSYYSSVPGVELFALSPRHGWKHRVASLIRSVLRPSFARKILPVSLYDAVYLRTVFSSMVALRLVAEDDRRWDWYKSF